MFTEILYVKIKKINQHKELINIQNKQIKRNMENTIIYQISEQILLTPRAKY